MAVLNPYNYSSPQGMAKIPRVNTVNQKIAKTTVKRVDSTAQYLERKVMTSTPQELTLMLYEGGVKFIKQAQIFNQQHNIEKTSNSILKAHAIYSELNSTLDMKYEISKDLETLYDYMLSELGRANMTKDGKILDELLPLAEEFCVMWKDAMQAARRQG